MFPQFPIAQFTRQHNPAQPVHILKFDEQIDKYTHTRSPLVRVEVDTSRSFCADGTFQAQVYTFGLTTHLSRRQAPSSFVGIEPSIHNYPYHRSTRLAVPPHCSMCLPSPASHCPSRLHTQAEMEASMHKYSDGRSKMKSLDQPNHGCLELECPSASSTAKD
jgi:hypothetical protein